ncbi:MAG: CDP-archaeol synthase [Pseudomonadota bacterium]
MIELKLFLLLLVANGAPILTRRLLGTRFNAPLDGGLRTSRGRRWLGPAKTLRGLISAILATTLLSPLLGFSWDLGIIFGTLAMLGDLIASFTKRRLGLPSSSQAMGLDQIPESLIPLIYCTFSLGLEWESLFLTVLVFWISGIWLSRLLYRFGIRRHPY